MIFGLYYQSVKRTGVMMIVCQGLVRQYGQGGVPIHTEREP